MYRRKTIRKLYFKPSLMSNNVLDQNRLRQVFFIIIILLLGILLSWQLYTFLPALLGAITLYILMHGTMLYLTEKKNWFPLS